MEVVLNKTRGFFSGLVLFSLFFGAGNLIFPLILGQATQGGVGSALIGFLVTAVVVPLSAIFGTLLLGGDSEAFFARVGRIPGKALIILLLALIGPLGGIPRCMSLSYSTLHAYMPDISLVGFSSVFALGLFSVSVFKPKASFFIGYVLAPILFFFLALIIFQGFKAHPFSLKSVPENISYGLQEGCNTMDFIAAFFFTPFLLQKLRQEREGGGEFIKATLVALGLIALVYAGLAVTAAIFSKSLMHVPKDHLLGELTKLTLGKYGGFAAITIVLVSTFTATLALTSIVAEFVRDQIFKTKISYQLSVLWVLATSVLVSTLGFSTIVDLLTPVLMVCYPVLLVLCLVNSITKR